MKRLLLIPLAMALAGFGLGAAFGSRLLPQAQSAAGAPADTADTGIYRRADLEAGFEHLRTLAVDDHADPNDSVALGRIADSLPFRPIPVQDAAVLRLSGIVAGVSKGCYRAMGEARITFRTAQRGRHAVASAWTRDGRPVAWVAFDTVERFDRGFGMDRKACLEAAAQ